MFIDFKDVGCSSFARRIDAEVQVETRKKDSATQVKTKFKEIAIQNKIWQTMQASYKRKLITYILFAGRN
jgi:hypothetical protein